MHEIEILVGLLIVVAALAVAAKHIALPYPVLLVVSGLALGFIPRLPAINLEPQVVFFILLPPLLYPAALFTSWRDFRASLRPILTLAVGLVLATMVVVAMVAHFHAGLPWSVAFALGAIVSPPDAVAANAIATRLRVPQQIMTVLEGESLVNDATALVANRIAVAAAMTGSFSFVEAGVGFVAVAIGGTSLGLAVGWIAALVHRKLNDPPLQITISLLTPFATYIIAEHLHVSGVLAVVAAGLFLGWRSPQTLTSRTRLNVYVFWEAIVFLLNGLVFVLIGLQLRGILERLHGQSLTELLLEGALLSAAVILVRILWTFASGYLPRILMPTLRRRRPSPGWRNVAVVAWTGMRGVVSLAAALSLPLTLPNGAPFPGRDFVLFVTFTIIFATLVLQGLTLPILIRALGVAADHTAELEERTARTKANEAALAYLNELEGSNEYPRELLDRVRAGYHDRLRQLEVCALSGANGQEGAPPLYERLEQEALKVERRTIIQLRNEYVINDEVLRRIQRDIDHAEARLHGTNSDYRSV